MTDSLANVVSGSVTFAVRDTSFEGKSIAVNDIIGIVDSKIEVVGHNVAEATESLIDGIFAERGNDGIVTLYYGADTPKEDAEALCEPPRVRRSAPLLLLRRGGINCL